MAEITSYSTLKTEIAAELNRTDLTSQIPRFIQTAEDMLRLDYRCRKLTDRGTVSISSDSVSMPSDFYALESWYHDGSTYFGPIEIVSSDAIGKLKAHYGSTGVPRFAAIVDGVARFAPAPDGTYSTKMTYWRKVTRLSDTNTTNWLLLEAPSIYLIAACVKAERYLKNDPRVAEWKADLEDMLEKLHLSTWDGQFSGTMRRQAPPIGG